MSNSKETTTQKKYTYVAPAPPTDLTDSTPFIIDFAARKFLHVGLDDDSSVVALIITPARHIIISPDFLRRIFNLTGNILSYLLDQPKYKRTIFINTESTLLSNMVYKDANVLVLESKTQHGCRVLLTRDDLMRLLNLETGIMKKIGALRIEESKKDSLQPTPPIIQSYSPMSPPRRTPPPFQEPWSSYPPILSPRQTRKEEEAVDHNDGPFGPQYNNTFATPSLGEELDMSEYLNFNKTS